MSESILDLHVPGSAVPWGTRAEGAWKAAIRAAVPAPPVDEATGIEIEFTPGGAIQGPLAPDIDNLCEPLFSALVNGAGWFGGKRARLRWYTARKVRGGPPGARMRVCAGQPGWPAVAAPLLDAAYPGPLPRSGSDPAFAAWATAHMVAPLPPGWFGVRVRFADAGINIGDIATGRVKNVIDCLWPLLGGRVSAPEDWRVTRLEVEQGAAIQTGATVHVTVWPEPAPPGL